jgi:hypothetical protein
MSASLEWMYFLSIDYDLNRMARFIEFTEDNFCVYSIELVRLYLSTCAEVDTILKKLCIQTDGHWSNPSKPNIGHYRESICRTHRLFKSVTCEIPTYGLKFVPWINFGIGKNGEAPVWWQPHNDVKHNRDENYSKANLENVLNAAAGLLIANLYLMATGKEQVDIGAFPRPILFSEPEELLMSHSRFGGPIPITAERSAGDPHRAWPTS